jgi:tRNA (guanine-N7-)-methyltransferase
MQSSHRTVRSFVRRSGRITAAQRRALHELWPRWGIEFRPEPLDLDGVFGRHAPRVMEIGFGDGELLVAWAMQQPDQDFLGVEVHEPGIGHCLLLIERLGLTNVRLIRHDAVEVLRDQIPAASLACVNLFFPDPWPKKRHHKRRLVQREFVHLLAARLAPGGQFRLATDWAPYAEHIDAIMLAERSFEPDPEVPDRPATKFERRGRGLGHAVVERLYCRRRCTEPPG